MKRRAFALLMALVMVLGMLPAGAMATEEPEQTEQQQEQPASEAGGDETGGENGGAGESTQQPAGGEPKQAANYAALYDLLMDETSETVVVTGDITIPAGENPYVLTTGDTVLIADGAHLTVEPGVTLKCPNGFSATGDYNLYNKASAAAMVTLAPGGGSPILYGSLADLKADVVNHPNGVNSVELTLKEPGAAYIHLDFDLPRAEYIYADDNLEIAPNVQLDAGWLQVQGDCIWYREYSVASIKGGEITGRYPRLMARPLYRDGSGFHEDFNAQMGGGFDFGRVGQDEFAAFYAQYYDGYQWVIAPVDVNSLRATGFFTAVRLSEQGWDVPDNYAFFWANAWNEEGSFDVYNVGGIEGLDVSFYLSCYSGAVNFFHEPGYDTDFCMDSSGAGVSSLKGRTIYVASYLQEDSLSNMDWYIMDPSGRELPAFQLAYIEKMNEYFNDGQTVWSVHIPAATIRDYPYGLQLGVRGTANDGGDTWNFDTQVRVYPMEAMGWTTEDVGDDLSADLFGILDDYITVTVGSSVTGLVYKTYYNEEEGCWKAGIYAADEGMFYSEHSDVVLHRADENDAHTVVTSVADSGWDNRIVWRKADSNVNKPDNRVEPLRVELIRRESNATFYEETDFGSYPVDELQMSPLRDEVFSFVVCPGDGLEVTGIRMPENSGVSVAGPQGYEGKYTVTIDKHSARTNYLNPTNVTFVLEVTDGKNTWQENYSLPAYVRDTVGWLDCTEIPGSISMDDLTDMLSMKPGEVRTGTPVRVEYREDEYNGNGRGAWVCSPHGSSSLYREGSGFDVEQNRETRITTLACTGSGQMALWLKVKGANAPDTDAAIPLILTSDAPYLSLTWLHDDGDGKFYESEDQSDSLRITPLEEYAVMFCLNWLEDGVWKSTPVVPQSLMNESGSMTLVNVRPLEDRNIASGQTNGDYFVWVKPHTDLWGQTVSLTGTVGEGESAVSGSIPVEVKRHIGGFYNKAEMGNYSFVTEWREAGKSDLYFGVELEGNLQLVGIYNYSDYYRLEEVDGQPNMRRVVLDMNRLPEDGAWIDVGFELTNGMDSWDDWYGIYVTGQGSAGLYTHNGKYYEPAVDGQEDTLPLKVLEDTEIFFKPREGALVNGAITATLGEQTLNWAKQDDGFYRITVPAETARALGNKVATLTVTVPYAGNNENTDTVPYSASAQTRHAIVWGAAPDEAATIDITDDAHGLSHELHVPVDTAVVGQAYYVWYNDDEQNPAPFWQADPYGGGYLRLEGGSFDMEPFGDNYSPTVVVCWDTDEPAYLNWTNHTYDEETDRWYPNSEVDRSCLPLTLLGEESLPGGFYESPNGNEDERVLALAVSPISGGSVYLIVDETKLNADYTPTVEGTNGDVGIVNLGGGVFEIEISPAVARSCVPVGEIGFTFNNLSGEGQTTFTMPLVAMDAIAWRDASWAGDPVQGQIVLSNVGDQGLRDWLEMKPGETKNGHVYFVYYNNEEGKWLADLYGGAYLRLEGEVFEMNSVPSGDDAHNWDDGTAITARGGGMGQLWWTNHAMDENGTVTGPNGEADYNTFSLKICSTGTYLTQNWVDQHNDGSWDEAWNEDTGCLNTPKDQPHRHTFYLNYWVDGEGWHRKSVVPQLSVTVKDKSGADVAVDHPEDYVIVHDVDGRRVDVKVLQWDCTPTLTASCTVNGVTYTASMDISVDLPREGFFSEQVASEEHYITSFQPTWGGENTFYFIMNSEEEGDAIRSIKTGNPHVTIAQPDANNPYLYKITVIEPTSTGEELWLDMTLASGEEVSRGIRLHGAPGYLAHRNLTNDGNGWYVGDAEYNWDLDTVGPGKDRWLTFSYVSAEGKAQDVEVTVTRGEKYVTLIKVADMKDENIIGDGGHYYYFLQTEPGAWDQQVTLSATVDGVTVSDTFTISEEIFSWYSQPVLAPDSEDSDEHPHPDRDFYISEFTFTDENDTLYLYPQMPEGWWVEDISTGWEDEDGNWYPFSGCDAIWDIRWTDNGFIEITLDPEPAQINYGRRNFGLDLQLRCKSLWSHDEMWGTGIHVENRLPYLTARSIDRNENGELVPSDRHPEDGMRTNPTQERFRVYYLNVFENGRWTEYPVQPKLHFFDGDEGGYVWFRKSKEPNSGEIVEEYGHFLCLNEDAWDRAFAIRGSHGDHTGFMRVDVSRDDVNFYSSPVPGSNTYLDTFTLNDLSGGNVFYVGAENDWVITDVSTQWQDGGETGYYTNADLVTVTRVTDRAWKITVDTDKVRQRFGRDDFELELRVESARGDDRDGRNIGIWVNNHLPYLMYGWLENNVNGWYLPTDDNGGFTIHDYFTMFPGDDCRQIYVMVYYDRLGGEMTLPVVPVVSKGKVTVKTLRDMDESIAEGQHLSDSFVSVTAGDNSWDTEFVLQATLDGHTAYLEGAVCRGEAEIYSSPTDIGNATVMHEFYKDPVNTANNVFWLAIRKADWADLDLDSVALCNDTPAEMATLGEMTESGDYYVWPVALTEAGTAAAGSFELWVDYTWVNKDDSNDRHDRSRNIWVNTGEIRDYAARFNVNFSEYFFVDAGAGDGSTWAYTWLDNGAVRQNIPGLTYNSETNTITLTNADLQQLEIWAKDLPNADLTIDLVGTNTVSGGNRGPALFLGGGINLTVTAAAKATLDISAVNDPNGDPWCHPAIHLWENENGNFTVAGEASVTASVSGEEYEANDDGTYRVDENDERIPAHMNTIGGNVESTAKLLVKDNAVLTIVPPEDLLSRWSGIEGFRTVELCGSAVLNTSRLDLRGEEDSYLLVLGNATLNVGMTGDDNGDHGYYFNGIYIHSGYLAVDGGTVNITAPDFATDRQLYTNAIALDNGAFGLTAGAVNVDFNGFTSTGDAAVIDGCGLRLGDNENVNATAKLGIDGGRMTVIGGNNNITGLEICANASAELSKGAITVSGWQGIVNHGLIEMYDGMTVTLQPWTDAAGTVYPTVEYGMFVNDIHYVALRESVVNIYGGELNITSRDGVALLNQCEYTQSGGNVTLKVEVNERMVLGAELSGRSTIAGGSFTVTAPIAVTVYPNENMNQNYFRLSGGKMTLNGAYNGLVVSAPATLQGGSLVVNQSRETADQENSAMVITDGGTLTVSGGDHQINGAVVNGGKTLGLRAFRSGALKFLGGSIRISGNLALVYETEQDVDQPDIEVAAGMYMHTPDEGTFLKYVISQQNVENTDVTRFTLSRAADDVPLTEVIIESGKAYAATANVETTTARATVGAPVTVQATVTANNGKAVFTLSNLELVRDQNGNSISINGIPYSGDLSNIPVQGSALVVFRAKPLATGTASVACRVEDVDGANAENSNSFNVYGFRFSAPTYTTYPQITVRGTGTPGDTFKLRVSGLEQPVSITVTELGTFAEQITLPVAETGQAETFTLTPEVDKDTKSFSVVYNPTSVRLDYLRITNKISETKSSTNTVNYKTGTGIPERSFYTYIPGLDRFDFETEFYVPLGWVITEARVEVTYMNGEVEKVDLEENQTRQVIHVNDNSSRTEYWMASKVLQGAPVDFKVVYRVARVKGTVVPDPEVVIPGPGVSPDDYEEENKDYITDVVPIIPIIDPSGTIYSGTMDNPVQGATVTLYYGGKGAQPAANAVGEVFDMAQYGQINPQITDTSGHYSWDVPEGWWKVVAEKGGFRAESQWIHVLPAHTDLHLNLNMPTAKSGAYDLIRVRPVTINGRIPTGKSEQFSAEVTVTNFTADESAMLMVAAYGEGGKYLGMQRVEINGLDKGVTTTVTVTLDNANGEAVSMKAFLVKNMADLTPVSAKVEFRNN